MNQHIAIFYLSSKDVANGSLLYYIFKQFIDSRYSFLYMTFQMECLEIQHKINNDITEQKWDKSWSTV